MSEYFCGFNKVITLRLAKIHDMKKITTFLLGLSAPFYFAQQAGDLVSAEQKLDLTPQGVVNFIANNLGEQNAPDFVSYLNSFNVGLKGYKITYYTKNEKNVLVKARTAHVP
jgi:hypothetical protein